MGAEVAVPFDKYRKIKFPRLVAVLTKTVD